MTENNEKNIMRRLSYTVLPLVILIISHIPYFFIFPLNYGWWQSWVNLWPSANFSEYVSHGYVFPPLYLEYYKLLPIAQKFPFISIFFGILRTLLLFFAVRFFIGRINNSNNWTASLIGFIVCIVIMRPSIYLPDDYHTFVSFFVFIALVLFYFIINYLEDYTYKNKINLLIFLNALFSIIVFLSKQNIGICLWFGLFFGFLFISINKHKLYFLPLYFLIFSFVVFVVSEILLEFSINDILNITINNESKGNKITLFTNFLIQEENFKVLYFSSILVFLYALVIEKIPSIISIFFEKILSNQLFLILTFITALTLFSTDKLGVVNYLACISAIYLLWMMISTGKAIYTISFPFLCLIFANTLTSGLASEDMIFLCIPILVFICNKYYAMQDRRISPLIFVTLILMIGTLAIHDKFKNPYSWYGIQQSSISYSFYAAPYRELQGISTDLVTFKSLSAIKEAINTNSLSSDDVLLYPNIPFFYVLHNKKPPYGIPVYWFDTAKKTDLDKLLTGLQNKKPRLIVFFDPPGFTYQGHSDMKKSITDQEKFMNLLDQYQREGIYKMINYITFDNSIYSSSNSDKFYNLNLILLNPEFNNKNIKYLVKKLENEDILYKSLSNLSSLNNGLQVNNILNVSVRGGDVDAVIRIIGKRLKSEDPSYSLKIYSLMN
jgi:hypothetical protein